MFLCKCFCLYLMQASSGTADVTVTQGSTTLTYSGYLYDPSLTATVNSISPNTLGVAGIHICKSYEYYLITQIIVLLLIIPTMRVVTQE